MDYSFNYYNRELWRWRVPFWYAALLNNPEYHRIYYSSKVDLYQSDMVRKGGSSRVSSKRPTAATVVGSTLPPTGQPALTYGGNGGSAVGGPSHHHNHIGNGLVSGPGKNSLVVLSPSSASGAADEDVCPQCGVHYNTSNYRKVTESCGHAKCRSCIIQSEEGCTQCSTQSHGGRAEKDWGHVQNNRKGPTIVDVTHSHVSSGSHHHTRRAAAAHRLQSATNSRANSVNSARPTSTSPSSSASNDTGRHSSSVYSDSADSDSCLRFPSSVSGGVENDGYAATIDFDAVTELTNTDPKYLSYPISDFNSVTTDNKSYSAIINEDSDFSNSLMGIRKLHESNVHNNNNSNSSSSSTSSALGTTYNGTLVTRAQLKELAPVSTGKPTLESPPPPTLSRVSAGSSTSPVSRRRTRDSSHAETDVVNSKIASGGGSPDITQGVPRDSSQHSTPSPRLSSPTVKANSSADKSGSGFSSTGTTSRLSALLTRSSSRNNRGNASEIPPDPLAEATPSSSAETRDKHSSTQAESSPSTSTKERNAASDLTAIKDEEESAPENGSDDDSKAGDEEDEEDDNKIEEADGEGEPVPKKKKKRSPVVIHDHITVLGGDPLMYQCNVCQKKFKTKAHIKYHEFCQKGDKPFKCEQCGQGFIAKSHYEYHLRTHTGERPYVCPKCGKGFNQRGKVTRHMRSHTGEKPFVCQECNRGFANAQALRSHTLIHTGERPFACTYCNKRFTGMTNLKKHVITHTGERPFTCNHCGKSFGLKWTLDLHLRTHSSERPYACDQCSRAFSNSKDLRRHLVIHSGERPFKCWICGTAFRRKDNLDRHIKNTHNQPKEVAKKLANQAAADYLKQTTKNQNLLNIPVSKVNSVVISNIIKNNDLMPAGGIVPNNLHRKQSASNQTTSFIKVTPKVEVKPSTSTSGSGGTGGAPSSSTSTPSSVQQSSPSSRRRVVITAPISPPTTRASRSKKTDSSKAEQRNSTAASLPSPTKKSSRSANKSTTRSKGASPQPPQPAPSTTSHHTRQKKEKVLPPPPQPEPTNEIDNVLPAEPRERKRKSKKKKAKKSKRKRQDRQQPLLQNRAAVEAENVPSKPPSEVGDDPLDQADTTCHDEPIISVAKDEAFPPSPQELAIDEENMLTWEPLDQAEVESLLKDIANSVENDSNTNTSISKPATSPQAVRNEKEEALSSCPSKSAVEDEDNSMTATWNGENNAFPTPMSKLATAAAEYAISILDAQSPAVAALENGKDEMLTPCSPKSAVVAEDNPSKPASRSLTPTWEADSPVLATATTVSDGITSQPTTTPQPYDPSMVYFAQSDEQKTIEGDCQILYAAVAATAEKAFPPSPQDLAVDKENISTGAPLEEGEVDSQLEDISDEDIANSLENFCTDTATSKPATPSEDSFVQTEKEEVLSPCPSESAFQAEDVPLKPPSEVGDDPLDQVDTTCHTDSNLLVAKNEAFPPSPQELAIDEENISMGAPLEEGEVESQHEDIVKSVENVNTTDTSISKPATPPEEDSFVQTEKEEVLSPCPSESADAAEDVPSKPPSEVDDDPLDQVDTTCHADSNLLVAKNEAFPPSPQELAIDEENISTGAPLEEGEVDSQLEDISDEDIANSVENFCTDTATSKPATPSEDSFVQTEKEEALSQCPSESAFQAEDVPLKPPSEVGDDPLDQVDTTCHADSNLLVAKNEAIPPSPHELVIDEENISTGAPLEEGEVESQHEDIVKSVENVSTTDTSISKPATPPEEDSFVQTEKEEVLSPCPSESAVEDVPSKPPSEVGDDPLDQVDTTCHADSNLLVAKNEEIPPSPNELVIDEENISTGAPLEEGEVESQHEDIVKSVENVNTTDTSISKPATPPEEDSFVQTEKEEVLSPCPSESAVVAENNPSKSADMDEDNSMTATWKGENNAFPTPMSKLATAAAEYAISILDAQSPAVPALENGIDETLTPCPPKSAVVAEDNPSKPASRSLTPTWKAESPALATALRKVATEIQVFGEVGSKRPRDEYQEVVPTRVQFLLPQSVPPVSTVAEVQSTTVSAATNSQPTTTPQAYDPSMLYFTQSDGQKAFEGDCQILYAAAAATAERDEGVMDGPPNKVRLLFCEAVGVGRTDSQNSNELQFYYAAATPNQHLEHTSIPSHIQLMEPCRVTYTSSSKNATSEMLQYQVHSNEQQHQNSQSEQQVFNHNPMYYYNYRSTATVSHQSPPPPPPPPLPPQSTILEPQQQQQHNYHDHSQYTNNSVEKLVVAHQYTYPGLQPSQNNPPVDYSHYNHSNSEVQDLSARHLKLPLHTVRSHHLAYSQVRTNDPVQYSYLDKAREVQHVFPQGAFRHCGSSYGTPTPTGSIQSLPNGLLPSYSTNGAMSALNGGNGNMTTTSGNIRGPGEGIKMTGLELLSAATEKLNSMQNEARSTERAAMAIAAVGEMARMKRMEQNQLRYNQQHRTPQQAPPPRPEGPHPSMQQASYNYINSPQSRKLEVQPSLPNYSQLASHINTPVMIQRGTTSLYPEQNLQFYQTEQVGNPSSHEMTMGTNQQAGIRRGPRKYYLARSNQNQNQNQD